MSDDLPAPVGPVIAKRSRPERSSASFSRKEVNPSTTSLRGLTGAPPRGSSVGLFVDGLEQVHQLAAGRGLVAPLVELGEQLPRRHGSEDRKSTRLNSSH